MVAAQTGLAPWAVQSFLALRKIKRAAYSEGTQRTHQLLEPSVWRLTKARGAMIRQLAGAKAFE
jgi:hypothetical protein